MINRIHDGYIEYIYRKITYVLNSATRYAERLLKPVPFSLEKVKRLAAIDY